MTTIADQIDGIIFPLPLEEKFKLWDLIEAYVKEEIEASRINKCNCSKCTRLPDLEDYYKEDQTQ